MLGSLFDAQRDPIGMLMRGADHYGDVVAYRFVNHDFFLLNDPDGIQHVLQQANWNYIKGFGYRGLREVLGNGLVTSEGDFWRRQRKLAQPGFHRERLKSFAATMCDSTAEYLARWERESDVLDIHGALSELTLRIVVRTLFSSEVKQPDAFCDAISVMLKQAEYHSRTLVRAPYWMPTSRNRRFKQAMEHLDGTVYGVIESRRSGGDTHQDLLAMLMTARDENTAEQMSDRQLRDEVLTMFGAGHETTANALTWLWYLVGQHPGVEARMRTEVQEALQGRTPTVEDLAKLQYVERVIQESMRLYPPAWAIERQAVSDDVVGGYRIPAGAVVMISPYVLHRHPKHWADLEGSGPEIFDPDRFLPERSKDRHRFAYLPFGGGPRMCIGNAFAMMEAKIIVAMMLQKYRVRPLQDQTVEQVPGITLRPRHGLKVRLEPVRA